MSVIPLCVGPTTRWCAALEWDCTPPQGPSLVREVIAAITEVRRVSQDGADDERLPPIIRGDFECDLANPLDYIPTVNRPGLSVLRAPLIDDRLVQDNLTIGSAQTGGSRLPKQRSQAKLLRERIIKKRGRPRKNGVQSGWMLGPTVLVLEAYDRSRRAGEKHITAIAEAVSAVRRQRPAVPISGTEVHRTLAKWRSKKLRGNQFLQTMLPEPERVLEGTAAEPYIQAHNEVTKCWAELKGPPPGPEVSAKKVQVVSVKFGPDPNYPRTNSKRPKQ